MMDADTTQSGSYRVHKVALRPTREQVAKFERHAAYARLAYNWGVEQFRAALDEHKAWMEAGSRRLPGGRPVILRREPCRKGTRNEWRDRRTLAADPRGELHPAARLATGGGIAGRWQWMNRFSSFAASGGVGGRWQISTVEVRS